MMQPKLIKVSAFLALITGLILSVYLSQHHYKLQYGMSEGKSFCSQNSGFDCDSVNISSFSELLGVPVALLGVFAFAVQLLFLLGIFILGEDEKSRPRRVFYIMSLGNLIFCFYLAVASWFILKTFCLYCFILYLICIVLFICAHKLKDESTQLKNFFKEDFKSAPVLILLLAIPLGSFFVHASVKNSISKDLDQIIKSAIYEWKENKKYEFYLAQAPSVGAHNPQLTLVVFSDFQCPHCKKSAPSLHAFVNAHKDKVKLYYQNYPLDSACNPKMQSSMHRESCYFTKAVLCAHEQNKYVEAHDWVFQHQEILSQSLIDTMIIDLKLDAEKIKSCMQETKVNEEIAEQIKRADLAELKGTPSIYANGKFLPYGFLIPVLEQALKESNLK